MGFKVPTEGYLENLYVNDSWLFEQFAGDRLWSCGYNTNGELGDNTITHRSSPVQTIAGGTSWKQVAFSNNHTAAIKTDGTLWTWGYNLYGHLGDNSVTYKSSPVQTVAGGTNWKQVACGSSNTAAIKTDGTLWMWGNNSNGSIGDNSTTHKSSPVQTIAGGTNWKQVSSGSVCTAAIKTDGTLWTWGVNQYGQLGDNSITQKSSPAQTIAGGTNWKQVSCGQFHMAAIKTDGTLWTWGINTRGQLGDNSTTYKSSPVQTIAGGTNWKQVSCGGMNTTAIKTDGTLWTWGYNNFGQLGDNSITQKSSPAQTIAGGTNWKQVSCGQFHMAAIKTDGTLWTWGINTRGQLGDNSVTGRSSPVQTIAGGTNWKQVSCGGMNTTAIKTDGTLWCCGYNTYGQVGDNTITHRSSPVQTVAGGTNWKTAYTGTDVNSAIKTDGTFWVWGRNQFGQLGDNTIVDKSSPIQTVAGGTNWKQGGAGRVTIHAISINNINTTGAE